MGERRFGNELSERIRVAIGAVLPAAVEVVPAPGGSAADLVINGTPVRVEWVGEGWPADVESALVRRPDVAVGRRISPGAREALASAGIGWVDETGAAEIALGPIIVSRTGHRVPRPEKPPHWTPSVLAVAEALLCGTKPTVAATAAATQLSTGSCANALRVLTNLGMLSAAVARGRHSAREVTDPDGLLSAYASAAATMRSPIELRVGVLWKDPVAGLTQIGRRWDEAGVAWAATGAVAASIVAPFLTDVAAAEVYVDADTLPGLHRAAALADLPPIEGGRLLLRPFPTLGVRHLSSESEGFRTAPWPRIYTDLRTVGVRGEEAAEHLREVKLGR